MTGKSLKEEEPLVYLSYLDDGGKGQIKVFGGVVLQDISFQMLEMDSAVIACELLPDEKRQEFDEFHASDLFLGEGLFEGIPEDQRREALLKLVRLKNQLALPYVYSAVDMAALSGSPFRSASWMDMAFHLCAMTICEYVLDHWQQQWKRAETDKSGWSWGKLPLLHLMVVDEPGSKQEKERLKNTFRALRPAAARVMVRGENEHGKTFSYSTRLHSSIDDMFFGSSSNSVGLQIADTCNWVMWRHLCGEDSGGLYEELNNGLVICAQPEPEWSQYKHLLKSHE